MCAMPYAVANLVNVNAETGLLLKQCDFVVLCVFVGEILCVHFDQHI